MSVRYVYPSHMHNVNDIDATVPHSTSYENHAFIRKEPSLIHLGHVMPLTHIQPIDLWSYTFITS